MDTQEVETIRTILPAIILIIITLLSLWILYMTDEINNPTNQQNHGPSVILKLWVHRPQRPQLWLVCNLNIRLKPGELCLLEVDNWVVLPIEITVRILTSFEDVLHSWAISSLGLKTDAIPWMLKPNDHNIYTTRPILWSMLQNLWVKP